MPTIIIQAFTQNPVEPEWHGGLDTGSFCITLPLEQVSDILGELEGINNDWDERAKSDPEASRNLNVC